MMRKNRLIKNNTQLFSLIAVFAILIASGLTHYLYQTESPLIISASTNAQSQTETVARNFADFNNDSIPEILSVIQRTSNIYRIHLADINNKLYEDFAFFDRYFTDRCVTHKDITGDGFDDVLIFYSRNDSIFYCTIDFIKAKIIEDEIFVLARPEISLGDYWDFTLNIGGFFNYSDGREELIFSIHSGHSQFPRGVYSFDFRNKKITNKFESGFAPTNVFFFDAEDDGKEEISIIGYSPGNNHNLPKYNISIPPYWDMKTWFIVLNEDFSIKLIDSIDTKYGYYTAGAVKVDDYYRLFSYGYAQNMDEQIFEKKIKVYDKNGNTQNDLITQNSSINNLNYPNGIYCNYIFQLSVDTMLFAYDSNLELVDKIELPFFLNTIESANFDEDEFYEYILYSTSGFLLLDDDLEILFYEQFDAQYAPTEEFKLLNYYLNPQYKFVGFTHEKARFEYILISNKIYSFILFIGVSSFFLFFFLFFISLKAAERIKIFYSNLLLSTRKSYNGIIVVSVKGKILYHNRSSEKLLSFNRKRESSLSDFIKQTEIYEQFVNLSKTGKRSLISMDYQAGKRLKQLRVTYLPINSPWGFLSAYYILIENLSTEISNERAKALSHSIQKVAHEAKTPLSSILLNIDLIEEKISKNSTVNGLDKNFEVTRKEVYRVKNFINHFLKYANQSQPTLEPVRAYTFISSAAQKFNAYTEKGITLEINIPKELYVLGDEIQLEEVMQVLIENGIDALGGTGKISINSKKDEARGKVKISVYDEGSGIEEYNLKKLFHPYFTTKKEGTGMGLAIAKKIVEDHGSKLEIESTVNKGTTVSFYLKSVEKKIEGETTSN